METNVHRDIRGQILMRAANFIQIEKEVTASASTDKQQKYVGTTEPDVKNKIWSECCFFFFLRI